MQKNHEVTSLLQSQKLQQYIRELPDFCRDYFDGIEEKNNLGTRIGYAINLKSFFSYFISHTEKYETISIKEFPFEGLKEIKAQDIEDYLQHLMLYKNTSNKSITNHESSQSRHLSALRSLYCYFNRCGRLEVNPALMVETPKVPTKRLEILHDQDITTLLRGIRSGQGLSPKARSRYYRTWFRDIAIITVFLDTGIRLSELINLDISDIYYEGNLEYALEKMDLITEEYDLEMPPLMPRRGATERLEQWKEECRSCFDQIASSAEDIFPSLAYLSVEKKGTQPDTLYISYRTLGVLIPYIRYFRPSLLSHKYDEDEALFLSMTGDRMAKTSIEEMMDKHSMRYLKKHLNPQKLRDTRGNFILRETGDLALASEVMRHKSINTLKRHYPLTDEEKKRSIAWKTQR
ncbi:MAG: tyrosine-type recombinase/integrase [Eubacteriales bacterium]|nr:tyrosine-type recombinase/integrase [Eubacteriales bacterium]